ncbi:toxin YoeB [Opitutia bacterium]|jgi:toxin YoeB|nr:toxin YoeB [Opitutae bacterium]
MADRAFWIKTDPGRLERIERLVRAIQASPFAGIGKPEPLRGDLTGWWSRRIDREHRLVYRVERGVLFILQARRHY